MEAKGNERKQEAYRIGAVVFILLAVFTIGEYFIGAIAIGWSAPLVLIALIKAWLVIRDYMHLPRLFSGEESH